MPQQISINHLELLVAHTIQQWANGPSTELTIFEICTSVKKKLIPIDSNDQRVDDRIVQIFHRLYTINTKAAPETIFNCNLERMISGEVHPCTSP